MKKEQKIVPQDSKRSLELIMRENPNMTSAEIFLEQKHDEDCYNLWEANKNKAKLELIKDINTNGGYYKGRFGYDQRFYYNVTNVRLEGNSVMATVEQISVFLGDKRDVVAEGEVRIEKTIKTWENLRDYGLDKDMNKRTTKKDYEKIVSYLKGIAKFWEKLK